MHNVNAMTGGDGAEHLKCNSSHSSFCANQRCATGLAGRAIEQIATRQKLPMSLKMAYIK
jgi:hypothetical protein